MEYKNITFSNLKSSSNKVIVGIDEAGRGPVVGYMVYAILVYEPDKIPSTLKDSKQLTDKTRRSLFKVLKDESYAFKALHPSFITTQMYSNINLNDLSWKCILYLIKLVEFNYSNIENIFIDQVGTPDKLKKYLEYHTGLSCVIESKADVKYSVVSGASIIAKVQRDDLIKEFNVSGTGYPSDPYTKMWLKQNCNKVFGWGDSVRYTWSTIKKILGINKSKGYDGRLKGFYYEE